jgi:hypothetical protein
MSIENQAPHPFYPHEEGTISAPQNLQGNPCQGDAVLTWEEYVSDMSEEELAAFSEPDPEDPSLSDS